METKKAPRLSSIEAKTEESAKKKKTVQQGGILTSPYGAAIGTGAYVNLDSGFSFSIPIYLNAELVFKNYFDEEIFPFKSLESKLKIEDFKAREEIEMTFFLTSLLEDII